MNDHFELRRTGHPPLFFQGRVLAEATGETVQDTGGSLKHNIRWYEASIYREETGLYVWSIRYRTTWRNEINHDAAGWALTIPELIEAIRAYNPLGPVAGMPFNERTNWRQDQLLQAMRLAWGEVASELFEAAGIVDRGDSLPPIRVFLQSPACPPAGSITPPEPKAVLLMTLDGRWRPLQESQGDRQNLLGFRTLIEAEAACAALVTAGVYVSPITLD